MSATSSSSTSSRSVGSSGVSKVELWGTRDGGRTWQVFGIDTDNKSPLDVKVDHEGVYGFRIAVVSGSGLGGQPPAEGDPADLWIGIDLSKPVGTLTGAEPSDDGAELVITWDAGDDALDVRPITLSFSEAARGPWTPIASGLENTGSYTWHIEGKVPALVYLRLEIRDEAGNVTVIDRPSRSRSTAASRKAASAACRRWAKPPGSPRCASRPSAHFHANDSPVSRSNASTYLARVFSAISCGSWRRRAVLVPAGRLQPVADELLVERRLRSRPARTRRPARTASCRA